MPAFDLKATMKIDSKTLAAVDHFLRRVDRVLDLSFVRDLTAVRARSSKAFLGGSGSITICLNG
jgi:hypothetical protein